MMRLAMSSFDEESCTTAAEETPLAKAPLSPPGGAESLFLAGLTASRLSAAAVSEQIKSNHSSRQGRLSSFDSRSIVSGKSVATDDFISCLENPSDLDQDPLDATETVHSQHRLLSLQIPESHEIEQSGEPSADTGNNTGNIFDSIMSTFYSNTKYTNATSPKMQEKPKPPMNNTTSSSSSSGKFDPDLSKIDPAEVVYSKAKDVWAWGKTVPVVSFFVGTTETVASKALGVAGTDFSTLDTKLSEELAKLDTGVLNPAMEAIAKAVISAAVHSEEHLKPLVLSILSTVGLIKSEANEANPEVHTSDPEITTK
jgi:hypothetical protein